MISARALVRVATCVTSKLGEEADACEDVIRVRDLADGGRIGASDGATTSSFSREWATRLAEWFTRRTSHPDPEAIWRIVPLLGRVWGGDVESGPLRWHAEKKLPQGAFATLLGVTVTNRRWVAVALGDTCLFHVRKTELLASFPYTSSDDFAARPVLASSVQPATPELMEHIAHAEGTLADGDMIVVATDALAHWLLRNAEVGQPAWDLFRSGDEAHLAAVVDQERTDRRMRNDDVGCAWF